MSLTCLLVDIALNIHIDIEYAVEHVRKVTYVVFTYAHTYPTGTNLKYVEHLRCVVL